MKRKRWTLKLVLCLLAGAVVTWGVAWGCALWGPRLTELELSFPEKDWPSNFGVPADWGRPDFCVEHRGWLQTRWEALAQYWCFDKPPGTARGTWADFGLPARSMRLVQGVFDADLSDGKHTEVRVMLSAPAALRPSADCLGLPVEVLPLGFALNTLFYAAVLLGVVEGVAFARRRVRRGRGRCPSCGYDRAGLAEGAACPECGGGGGGKAAG